MRWTSCSFISVLFIEGDTEAKTTGFTSFAWANLQFSGRVTLVNRFLNAVSEIVSLKATDTTFLRCRFSPVFIGLNVGFREFFEDWPHHGIIFWLTCCCHWRWWGLLIRQKGSCRLAFILNVMDIDPIPSIIHFIIFPRIWIIRIFWVISALRSQFIGIMQRSHPSNCLCQLIGLLYLTFRVFMQLGENGSKSHLQNFRQSTEHYLIDFDDIPSCERIRGGIGWLTIGGNSFFPWILCMCHDWCGFCRQIYCLSWAAVKTSYRFTGKAAKGIFWNSGGIHPLLRHSRLRNEIRQTAPQGNLTPPNIPMFLSFWNAHQQNVPTKTQLKLVKSHIAYGIKVSEYSQKIEVY